MRKVTAALLLSIIAMPLASWAQSDPSLELRVKNAGEATGPEGATYPSVVSPAASRPDAVVSGSAVTITDFRDLVLSVNGAPAAATSVTLQNGGSNAGRAEALGLYMDKPLTATISAGTEHFTITGDNCSGTLLGPPGDAGSTCQVTVQPRASWFGPLSGTLRLSTGGYTMDVPLSGAARHFDLPNLTITAIAGAPASLNVAGQTEGEWRMSAPATFRITNTSTEEATDMLVALFGGDKPGSFEFVSNACSGQSLGAGASCDITVRARADRNGSYAGTLLLANHNQPSVALAGTATGFLPVAWKTAAWGACDNACGTSSRSRSVWCERSDGVTVADSFCGAGKPQMVEACTSYATCTYAWRSGDWGACANACGGSSQSRSVWCERSDGTSVDASNCGSASRPNDSQSCTNYSGCSYSWVADGWGGCSASCGGGSQSRSVWCRRSDGASVDGGNCGWGSRPNDSQSCNTHGCCVGNMGQACARYWCQSTYGDSCGNWIATPSTCEQYRGGWITSCSEGNSICCGVNDGRIQCNGSCQ
jgi:hypothetical protein